MSDVETFGALLCAKAVDYKKISAVVEAFHLYIEQIAAKIAVATVADNKHDAAALQFLREANGC